MGKRLTYLILEFIKEIPKRDFDRFCINSDVVNNIAEYRDYSRFHKSPFFKLSFINRFKKHLSTNPCFISDIEELLRKYLTIYREKK